MTDLEKRAEEYADTKYIHGTSEWIKIKQSYLDSTEAETTLLSEHILELQADKGRLTDELFKANKKIEKLEKEKEEWLNIKD